MSENKDNREYIRGLFDGDGISAPESLSEENMLSMLEEADGVAAAEKSSAETSGSGYAPDERQPASASASGSGERRVKARPQLHRYAALAAAALVVVFGISGLVSTLGKAPDTSEVNGELYTFKSEGEIERTLKSLDQSSGLSFPWFRSSDENSYESGRDVYTLDGGDVMDAESSDMAAPSENAKSLGAASSSDSAAGSSGHSSTYLQVDDVDESDIVKTDGKYIYYVNTSKEVVILSAKDGKTEKVGTIGSSGVENYVQDIYLKGDTLITVGTFYKSAEDGGSSGVVMYDISDRSRPELISDFRQSGDIVSSRMVGNFVYLVTNDSVYRGGRSVPMCGSSSGYNEMPADEICCVPEPVTPSYVVLSAIDISSGKQGRAKTKAILGASSEIYCNDHNLYAASQEYDRDKGIAYTRIVRASLNGLDVGFSGTARINGRIKDQFSMDERNGYFRIATTSTRSGMDVNNLYILDGNLKETGSVSGFARNESIKSVRYMGDKAYVITYQAIDPLFIIDLSDPASPRIEGEVMIDGFSTLLVPIGNGRLLGIGHATGDNGYGGEYDSGLKLALFDISDPSQPKVLASREFKDMTSPAQSDHHALTVNTGAGWFAIPYDIYHYDEVIDVGGDDFVTDGGSDVIIEDAEEPEFYSDGYYHEAGVLVFRAGDKITDVDQHALGQSQLFRSVYIGDWIYALDARGDTQSFKPAADQ